MESQNEIIFVSGKRGSGKSYWVKNYIRSLPRVMIFDSLGEYEADKRFGTLEELLDFLEFDQANPRLFRVAYDTHLSQKHFPMFCRMLLARGNMHVVIEELDLYSTPFLTDENLLKLLKYGRHFGIQLVGVSRRAAEVSRHFTSATSKMMIFPQHEPNDIKYFRSIIGNLANELPQLPLRHFLSVDFNTDPHTIEKCSPIKS
jgi:hypothetical protein